MTVGNDRPVVMVTCPRCGNLGRRTSFNRVVRETCRAFVNLHQPTAAEIAEAKAVMAKMRPLSREEVP